MKQHLGNVLYGFLDYAAYPAAMLLAAPIVLHNLGVAAYGMWSVVTAVVSAGSILAAGFGDANIQHVSRQRGQGNRAAMLGTVRMLLACNLLLALVAAAAVVCFGPLAARHIVRQASDLRTDCIHCLYLAALLIILRAIESVCISTQRAFERYGAAIRVSVLARLLCLVAGAALTWRVRNVSIILLVAVVVNTLSTLWQFTKLRGLLDVRSIRPAFDLSGSRSFFRFGGYSWLLAASGILFGQVDRIVMGVWMGAAPVAAYALSTQLAQPIYGVTAAGLHFLLPHLANRSTTLPRSALRHTVLIAVACNAALVVGLTVLIGTLGPRVLTLLGRGALGDSTTKLFVPIVISAALLGLSVTPTYALYAFDRIRLVSAFNLVGGAVTVLSMLWLGRAWGVTGIAYARFGFGAASVLLYLPLMQLFRSEKSAHLVPLSEGA
jgi:O-antigen/teichoic acid export membrane protein